MEDYVEPRVNKVSYHCPHCGSYSDQYWNPLRHNNTVFSKFDVGLCHRCNNITFWNCKKMIFPLTGNAPTPNSDMPKNIKKDYLEARDIVSRSPRAACILLRLCVEKICDEQEKNGNSLNEKIGNLVKKGLNPKITRALDIVRVIGGQAAHPLVMQLDDDVKTASALFKIINYISDWAYTSEKMTDDIFNDLPDSKKESIKKRDEKNTK